MKKNNQTPTELLGWCDTQQTKTVEIIDQLLDNPSWKSAKNRKALEITGKILKNIDLLRAETLREILPSN